MKGWVLVTGAAGHTGRAIALDLAAHGWDIVVHCHASVEAAKETARLVEAMGRNALIASIDLSDPALAAALIPSLGEEIGMMDALVNNAALILPDAEDPDGSRHMAVNAEAPRILGKAFRDHLPPREKGCIVNLLDGSPVAAGFSAYGRSKAALAALGANMARGFRPQVRVNAVAPCGITPSARTGETGCGRPVSGHATRPDQVARAVRRLIEDTDVTGLFCTMDGTADAIDPERQRPSSSTE